MKKNIAEFVALGVKSVIYEYKIDIELDSISNNFFKFLKTSNLENSIIDFINFTFSNISKISTLKKPIELFDLLTSLHYDIAYEKILEIVINDRELMRPISRVICDKFEIKLQKIGDIEIIIDFLKSLFKYLDFSFLTKDILRELIKEYLFIKGQKMNLQDFVDFLMRQDKNKFWKKISQITKIKYNQEIIENLVQGLNYILKNISTNSLIFQSILKLKPTKLIYFKNQGKTSWLNILKIIQKFSYIEEPMNILTSTLYKKSVEIKQPSKNDPYYQFLFRLILLCLLFSYNLFISNNLELFWSEHNTPSVVKIVMKFFGIKKSTDSKQVDYILEMIGEKDNFNLIKKESKLNDKRMIPYIYSLDKSKKIYNKEKVNLIFKLLKKGFWS